MSTLTPALDRARATGRRHLFGKEFRAAKSACWTTQWLRRDAIAAHQWDQIRDLIAHARAHSAFYRDRLGDGGVPSDLTAEAFRRIPPLSRSDVASAWAGILAGTAPAGPLRRQSGGSGDAHVEIPLDRAAYCWYIAGTWRGLRWWGADFGDRGAVLLGGGATGLRRVAVRAKDWVMQWLRVPIEDAFDREPEPILDRLAAFRPVFLYGYPSAIHRLARTAMTRGWPAGSRLKVIVLTGEPVYAFQRRAIGEAFQCPVAEEYGSGELGSMAFQCPAQTLHVTAENVFLETIDAQHILATQLRNRVFPLIRYETGDAGLLSQDSCPCGRELPSVRVLGRLHDRLVGAEVARPARPWVEQFLGALPEDLQGRVQVVHPTPGCITLRIEGGAGAPAALREAAGLGAETVGSGWRVAAVEVDRLVRLRSGKLPYFVRSESRG